MSVVSDLGPGSFLHASSGNLVFARMLGVELISRCCWLLYTGLPPETSARRLLGWATVAFGEFVAFDSCDTFLVASCFFGRLMIFAGITSPFGFSAHIQPCDASLAESPATSLRFGLAAWFTVLAPSSSCFPRRPSLNILPIHHTTPAPHPLF